MSVSYQVTPWVLALVGWFFGAASFPACNREVLLGHLSEPPDRGTLLDARANFDLGNRRLPFRSAEPLATAPAPQAIHSADLDRDGQLDLVVAHAQAGLVRSFLGRGDGTFPRFYDTPCGDAAVGLAIADFDQDQRLDLAVTLATQGLVQVFAGRGDGTFTAARTYATGSGPLLATDLNGDGRPDVAVATATEVVILLSGSLGVGFEPLPAARYPIGSAASALAAGDLNRDSFPDLVIAMGGLPALQVLSNNGSGGFSVSAVALEEPSRTIALVALDSSGVRKGAVAGSTTLSLLDNQDGRLFQDLKFTLRYPVGRDPRLLASADLDRDGHLDLLTASASEPTLSVLFGTGTGDLDRLGVILQLAAPATALTIGDWNHDAIPDIALVTSTPAQLHVLFGFAAP